MDLAKIKSESRDIYQTLFNSQSMYNKCLKLEYQSISVCLDNALGVLLNDYFSIITGSRGVCLDNALGVLLNDYFSIITGSRGVCLDNALGVLLNDYFSIITGSRGVCLDNALGVLLNDYFSIITGSRGVCLDNALGVLLNDYFSIITGSISVCLDNALGVLLNDYFSIITGSISVCLDNALGVLLNDYFSIITGSRGVCLDNALGVLLNDYFSIITGSISVCLDNALGVLLNDYFSIITGSRGVCLDNALGVLLNDYFSIITGSISVCLDNALGVLLNDYFSIITGSRGVCLDNALGVLLNDYFSIITGSISVCLDNALGVLLNDYFSIITGSISVCLDNALGVLLNDYFSIITGSRGVCLDNALGVLLNDYFSIITGSISVCLDNALGVLLNDYFSIITGSRGVCLDNALGVLLNDYFSIITGSRGVCLDNALGVLLNDYFSIITGSRGVCLDNALGVLLNDYFSIITGSRGVCLDNALGVLLNDYFSIITGSRGVCLDNALGVLLNDYFSIITGSISVCLDNALGVLLNDYFSIITGSRGEGTDIVPEDYGKNWHSLTPCYVSDMDIMNVWCHMQVTEEGDTLPQRFDNHLYCRAERGEHTTDGFRKLRIVHRPDYFGIGNYLLDYRLRSNKTSQMPFLINKSVRHGFISSSTFLAATANQMKYLPNNERPEKPDLGTQGPSKMIEVGGSATDFVQCFYVKAWPREAESWFKRQTHWPEKELKSKIKNIGYLLVPTGNSQSQESDLEWRCSFSIAEKILFQTMTNFQRCIFVILKVLLKEYLPSDINTDGEKQLLSTYHMKTLFLWCLEDSELEWEPEDMLAVITHMFEKLLSWLKQQYFPHYFIPSVNLLDGRQLHDRGEALIFSISAIRNDISSKIVQSQFYTGQEISHLNFDLASGDRARWWFYRHQQYVMKPIIGILQGALQHYIFARNGFEHLNLSHSVLREGIISIKPDLNQQIQHLYRGIYSDPVHDKLLTEVVPRAIDQYSGCILLAKYCIAAQDGLVIPYFLSKAASLLKDTLHLDPCLGYVKLACLYIATEEFEQAVDQLDIADSNFLYTHTYMESGFKDSELEGVDVNTITKEIGTLVFQKWVDCQVTCDIVVTWLECFTVPDLLQFELIHECTQYIMEVPHIDLELYGLYKQVIDVSHITKDEPGKMVGLDYRLHWPPLSMIKLLKFVCALNSGQSSTTHMENLVADLVASSLSLTVFDSENDIHTVFNMAAWCYVKIKKYKPATRMMTVAIGSRPETKVMKRCAFSHQFVAYVIGQCVL